MSELQNTEKKKLTAKDIIPNWYNQIAFNSSVTEHSQGKVVLDDNRKFYKDGKYFDLSKKYCCVVGEAWKGDDEYGDCEKCDIFSNKFAMTRVTYDIKNLLDEFVDHWNEKHI